MRQKTYQLTKNKYLSESEFQALKGRLSKHNDLNPNVAIAIEVALYTGARAQEVLNITTNDIQDRFIHIKGLKGSNDREIPIDKNFDDRLKKYITRAQFESGERIFQFSYEWLRTWWNEFRPVPKKFHSLRHTFALRLYQRTKDIHLVKVALGHRSVVNTQIYLDYEYSRHELKKAILGT